MNGTNNIKLTIEGDPPFPIWLAREPSADIDNETVVLILPVFIQDAPNAPELHFQLSLEEAKIIRAKLEVAIKRVEVTGGK